MIYIKTLYLLVCLVRQRGLEPPRAQRPLGPEPSASADSATAAYFLRRLNITMGNVLCQGKTLMLCV